MFIYNLVKLNRKAVFLNAVLLCFFSLILLSENRVFASNSNEIILPLNSVGNVSVSENNYRVAYDKALKKALEMTLYKSLNLIDLKPNVVKNNKIISLLLYSKYKIIEDYKVLNKKNVQGEYSVELESLVNFTNIHKTLKKHKLIELEQLNNSPRIMVFVDETIGGQGNLAKELGNKISNFLSKKRFKTINVSDQNNFFNEIKNLRSNKINDFRKFKGIAEFILVLKVDYAQINTVLKNNIGHTRSFAYTLEGNLYNTYEKNSMISFKMHNKENAVYQRFAVRIITDKLFSSIQSKLISKLIQEISSRKEVSIYIKNVQSANEIIALKKGISGIDGVRITSNELFENHQVRFDLHTKNLSIVELKQKVEMFHFCDLLLEGKNNNNLYFTFKSKTVSPHRFILSEFKNDTENNELNWLNEVSPIIFETMLENSNYLEVVKPFNENNLRYDGFSPDYLIKYKKDYRATLAGIGKIVIDEENPDLFKFFIRIYNTDNSSVITSSSVECKLGELSEGLKDLAFKVDKLLFDRLYWDVLPNDYSNPYSRNIPADTLAVEDRMNNKNKKAELANLIVKNISLNEKLFNRNNNNKNPTGYLILNNNGKYVACDVSLSIYIPGVSSKPQINKIMDIYPEKTTKIPFMLNFDDNKIKSVQNRHSFEVQIRLKYFDGDIEKQVDFKTAMIPSSN